MKKLALMIVMGLVVLQLAACGGNSSTTTTGGGETSKNPAGYEIAEAGYVYTVNGTKLVINAPAEDALAALGNYTSLSEIPSCAMEGMDKAYFYGSMYLITYEYEDVEYIYQYYFVDDTVQTDEGVAIGDSSEDVDAAYGSEAYNKTNAYEIKSHGMELTIIMTDNIVTSIQYTSLLEK